MKKKFEKDIGMEEIGEGLGINKVAKVKGMELKIKFSPAVTIYMGEEKLGSIKFDNLENMGEFVRHLGGLLKDLVRDYNIRKK